MTRVMASRWVGWLLVGAAVLILLSTAQFSSVWALYAFVFCLVLGWLLAAGIVGTSPAAARARTLDAAVIERRPRVLVPTPHVFRYPRPGPGIWVLFAAMSALMLGLAVYVTVRWPGPLRDVSPSIVLMTTTGVLAPIYLMRHAAVFVGIDGDGIQARGYLRSAAIRWEDVVALHSFGVRLVGLGTVGGVFDVYSRAAKIRFFDSLDGAQELTALIAGATGLDWNERL